MVTRIASAPARTITAAQAANMVRSGDWLDFGACLSQPDVFERALATRVQELTNVRIRCSQAFHPRAILEADPKGTHFHWFSWHFNAYERAKHDAGICNYIPLNLGEVPDYYR